ncbi:DinB family protein [Adhaeribacter sp. BT258]|uniref:DinB family protein n=1 Tax=Adhaeribacter terrigena TaxID=2793070 RepID=A0ABS1C3I8_9BACT|nr:DinB family protein [Adhaeribacter terrigena]MBK0403115.1 DinB family protein [Adhaeribacter terrigena]
MNNLQKPAPSEYPAYFETYLKRLPETDILALLETQCEDLLRLFGNLEESETEKGYAEGKWSLKELLQHMLDTERIMAYRALCFARKEPVMLPGFDEDNYAAASDANRRKIADLITEYRLQRQSTIMLFKSFSPEMIDRFGKANNATYNVRSLAWVIAAHENHHLHIIQTLYLKQEVSL